MLSAIHYAAAGVHMGLKTDGQERQSLPGVETDLTYKGAKGFIMFINWGTPVERPRGRSKERLKHT